MCNEGKITRGVFGSLPMIAAGCVLSLVVAAESSVEEDLKRCGALQDQAARVACYDGIVARLPESEQASNEAESVTADAEDVAAPASDNDERLATLGAEQIGERRESERLEIHARVVGCKKDDFRRNFFYFENGQVWKQKSGRRLIDKECDFNITITKDFFGYKMVREGETRHVRISRVK